MLFNIYLQAGKTGGYKNFLEITKPDLIGSYFLDFKLHLFYLIYLLRIFIKLLLFYYNEAIYFNI